MPADVSHVTSPPAVTVAVVVKDRVGRMAACLDGIERLTGPAIEVVLVDNGSTDGTLELLRTRAEDASVPTRVVVQHGALGAARNAAVAVATAPVLAFTDSDCIPDPGWVTALLDAMTADVAVVQGRTVPASDPIHRWAATQQILGWSDLYETCNIAYRVDLLRAAGGFSEEIGFFGEDTAAGWSVRRLGGRGVFAPDALVLHDVTYPGAVWYVVRGLGYRNWPALVRRYPEMREELLWKRLFLRPRRLAAWAWAGGLLGGVVALCRGRVPWALGLLVPELILHRPSRGGVAGVIDTAAGVSFDMAVTVGLARGSVEQRTPVL